MRETSFIEQNENKWKEFEQILEGENRDPEKLNALFIQVTDDLSYARTFYPNRSVRVYLNGLAQRIFFSIYKSKRSRRRRLVSFWVDDLPLLLYQSRKELLFAFLLFAISMAIGMLSSAADPEFLRLILGDAYVNMTKANIASGDPMAVYKQRGEFNMFLGITLNNLIVALQTFMLGIFYAIGTIGSLLYNGIMLGAFQYFFIEQDLFLESFLAVWLHGAFEISSIVIAGAAGIAMGRGLVFPGTLSRIRSFQLSARRGISLMIGVVPLFILAGFIESFLTRFTDAPDVLRGLFILVCLGFVLFYFVIYPYYRFRSGTAVLEHNIRLTPDNDREVDLTAIKTTGDLLSDSFLFYKKNFKQIARVAFFSSVCYCTGVFLLARVSPSELFQFESGLFSTLLSLPSFFENSEHPWIFPLTAFSFTLIAHTIHRSVAGTGTLTEQTEKTAWLEQMAGFIKTGVVAILFNLLILPMEAYAILLFCLTFPLLFQWSQIMFSEKTGLMNGLVKSMKLTHHHFMAMSGLFLSCLICGIFFFLILDTGIIYLLLHYMSMNFFMSAELSANVYSIVFTFFTILVMLLIFALLVTGSSLQYYSNKEVNEAAHIREEIRNISPRHRIRGMDRE